MTKDEVEDFRTLLLDKFYETCDGMKEAREAIKRNDSDYALCTLCSEESFTAYIRGMGYVVHNLISEIKKEAE